MCRYLRYHFIILLVYLSTYLLSRYVIIPLGRSPSHSVIVIAVVVVLCTEGGRERGRVGGFSSRRAVSNRPAGPLV